MMNIAKKILFFIMMVILFNINSVKAEECSEERIKELQKIADNIFVDVEFDYESADAGIYNSNYVMIQGLTNDLYIYTDDSSVLFTIDQQNEKGVISRIVKDNVSKLYVYSQSCPNTILKKIDISLNRFNQYSEYEECKGEVGKELDICDEFYDKEISEKEFYEEIEKYEENKKNNILKKNNIFKILIPIVGVIVIILTIIIVVKKIKDNRLD